MSDETEYQRIRRNADRSFAQAQWAGKCYMACAAFVVLALMGIFTQPGMTPEDHWVHANDSLWDQLPLLTKIGALGILASGLAMVIPAPGRDD